MRPNRSRSVRRQARSLFEPAGTTIRWQCRQFSFEELELRAVLTPVIVVGDHLLLPNTPNQEVDIFVSSPGAATETEGVDLFAQVADGGPPAGGAANGPTIRGSLLAPGTLFADNNTGEGNLSIPMGYYANTTTSQGTVVIPTSNVLLARLFLDTTGFTGSSPGDLGPGQWSLNLSHTAAGSTDLGLVQVAITDGAISIDHPIVPVVQSINRSSPVGAVTSGPSVSYQVRFSEPVTGVDPSDFALVSTGSATATTLVTASGSGAIYTVTVNGVSGSGTLGLSLVDDNSIVNAANVPLGGAGIGDGNFTGQVYTIDQPPVVDPNGTDAGTYVNTWTSMINPVSVVDPTNTSHGATITDPDDANMASLTVSIASPALHDVLNATGQGNVTVSGGGTSRLVFTPVSGSALLADFQATLRTATYCNTTGDEGAGPKAINFTAVDARTAAVGTATSQIVIPDQPPVIHPNGTNAGTYTNTWSAIGSPASVVDPTNTSHGATITDPDDTNLASFTVSIVSPAPHDVLNATGQGNVTVLGSGTNMLVFTPTSVAASLADFQATLRTATYDNTNGDQGLGRKIIDFVAIDATTGGSGTATSKIVIAVPVLVIDPNGNNAGTFVNSWARAGAVGVVDPTNTSHGATITDTEDSNLASLTVSIASPAPHDVLNATGQGNVTVSGSGTNTLVFKPTSGTASLADFQATLRTATYNNTAGDAGASSKTIRFVAVDATAGVLGTATSQIVIPDQPPAIDPNGTDAGTYTNTWSAIGTPVSVVDPTNTSHGATVTDPDDTNLASLTVSIASPTPHDVLNATGQGNVAVLGSGTNMLVFTPTSGTATLADFQATLRTANYDNTNGDTGLGPKIIIFTAVDFITGATATANSLISVGQDSGVVGRFIFYAGSTRFDTTGNPRTPKPFSDDNAIATDKIAYFAGAGPATFTNVISYDKGINGIMVDLIGGADHTAITQANITSDFTFKVGNNNLPSTWSVNAVLPTTVTVRTGAGVGGSDRVELIWPSGSIKEKWLEVDVKPTAHTGVAADDVFFFGSAIANSGIGDTFNLSETNSTDEMGARTHFKSLFDNIPISNIFDYNRDGLVSSVDVLLSRNNTATLVALRYINIPGGVFSPPPSGGSLAGTGAATAADSGGAVSLALVSSSASPAPSAPGVPAWLLNRLSHVNLNSGPVAKYLTHLAEEDTTRSRAILVKADHAADALDLDDTLLDSLLVRLGLE